MDLKYVAVSGYGWSGSGAVVDILKEVEGFKSPDIEFRLFSDPGGILDLETFLVYEWDLLRSNAAINDFIELCHIYNRPQTRYQYGGNARMKLTKNFIKYSLDYVASLSSFSYYGNSMIFSYNLSKIEYFLKKYLNDKLKLQRISRPNKQEFTDKTKLFLNKIFTDFAKGNNTGTIILDQVIPVISNTTEMVMKYFENIKLIVVDRDPRDIYVELDKYKTLFVNYDDELESVYKYIEWFKTLRANNLHGPQVKCIKFENLVNNYEEILLQIVSFIDVDIAMHKNKFMYFIPQESKNNIGIWRNYKSPKVMALLSSELREYCYD
jgi:hypothetical protein